MFSGKFEPVLAVVIAGLIVGSCSHARNAVRGAAGIIDARTPAPSSELQMRRDTINCYTQPPVRCVDPAI